MPDSHTFPKSARLRRRVDYVRLSNCTSKFSCKGFLIVWQPNGMAEARLGITVSKKVGNAAVRNRIKRYVREIFRCGRQALPAIDMNIIARRDAALIDFNLVKQELERTFRHIGAPSCSRASRSS